MKTYFYVNNNEKIELTDWDIDLQEGEIIKIQENEKTNSYSVERIEKILQKIGNNADYIKNIYLT